MTDHQALAKPLLIDEPQRLITFRIARLNARLTAQAHRILSKTAGISLSQWRVFAIIDSIGDATAADIVRRTNFDKALISRTVSAMIADGHLSSTPDPSDQRRQVLQLTAKGRATAERAREAMRTRQETLLGCMTDEQRAALFANFDQIEETLDQMEAAR